jgi:drug/metabolite transporter (DMT)-like permease
VGTCIAGLALYSWLIARERATRLYLAGLGLSVLGVLLLVA